MTEDNGGWGGAFGGGREGGGSRLEEGELQSPEDAGVGHWGSHQPRATPSFKAKVVSMFVDCRFLEEKSKIGYIQGFRELY